MEVPMTSLGVRSVVHATRGPWRPRHSPNTNITGMALARPRAKKKTGARTRPPSPPGGGARPADHGAHELGDEEAVQVGPHVPAAPLRGNARRERRQGG